MSNKRIYHTHDNGGRPYCVVFDSTYFEVYTGDKDDDTLVLHGQYEKQWIGDNCLNEQRQEKGNSILLRDTSGTYLFIGHCIYTFESGSDEILTYCSPVGNSDVPYPYAIGRDYVYFMLDKKRVPVEHVDQKRDGYAQFYHEIPPNQKKSFRVKVIHTPSN